MTATFDNRSFVMQQLISSCYRAHEDFRTAAAAVDDGSLKRLFEIYAQQRNRFAQELREHLPTESDGLAQSAREEINPDPPKNDLLRHCLDTESKTVQLYQEVLSDRALPTRTQFLISSQLALMQGARERVSSLLRQPEAAPAQMAAART